MDYQLPLTYRYICISSSRPNHVRHEFKNTHKKMAYLVDIPTLAVLPTMGNLIEDEVASMDLDVDKRPY